MRTTPIHPHRRDPSAHHTAFDPYELAVDGTTCWVTESAVPLIVRVDWETAGVEAVHEVPKFGVQRLLVHEGAVWVEARLGAFRLLLDGSIDPLNLVGRLAASESVGAWMLSTDGFLLRLSSEGRVVAAVARITFGAGQIVAGERLIWLTIMDGLGRTILAGHDAATGRRRVSIEFEGQVDPLGVTAGTMWIKTTRLDHSGGCSRFVVDLVGIDERTGKVVSRAPTPLGKRLVPASGLVWQVRDEFCKSPNEPRSARGHDPTTGALLTELEIPPSGLTGSTLVDDRRIWGISATGRAVIAIPLDGSAPKTFTFESVDISPFRPPPPAPIDAETTERELLERLRKAFYDGWISRDRVTGEEERRPLIGGVEFDDVRLEGTFPDTHVVVTFTSSERPGVRFARECPVWDADGALALAEWMDINLMEDIEAGGHGLPPNPIVGDDGLSWF